MVIKEREDILNRLHVKKSITLLSKEESLAACQRKFLRVFSVSLFLTTIAEKTIMKTRSAMNIFNISKAFYIELSWLDSQV